MSLDARLKTKGGKVMSRRDYEWRNSSWYPPSPPKKPPPEHGIRLKTDGATWWGRRWVEALEDLSWQYSNRLGRGRTYARAGRVHDVEIEGGDVSAKVIGTRSRPYRVTITISSLRDSQWAGAMVEMSARAVIAAKLLTGEMPKEIDEAFGAVGVSLFPSSEREIETSCDCPDWANPCKHVAATHLVLAEAFDKDPFLLFELRGRGREAVLAELNRLRATAGGLIGEGDRDSSEADDESVPSVTLGAEAAGLGYETPGADLDGVHVRFETPAVPLALLRGLGNPKSWSMDESMAALLAPAYETASRLALEIALAEDDIDSIEVDAVSPDE